MYQTSEIHDIQIYWLLDRDKTRICSTRNILEQKEKKKNEKIFKIKFARFPKWW